ncbi:MAG: hypothetical protein WC713_00640, partial [Candidatus Methylomirabilota bacterium]
APSTGIPIGADLLLIAQNGKSPPEVLEQIAAHPDLGPDVLLALLRNPQTPAGAMVRLAAQAAGPLLEALLSNLDRLGRWTEGLEAILTNPGIPEVRRGVIQKYLEAARKRDAEGTRTKSLLLQVKELPVGARLALAKKGNKDVRMILIKDSNEMVALEVVTSPRITDGEILAIASMRDVADKILRYIANNRKFRQNKQIILALLNNPRTPVGISLGLGLSSLTERELSDLAKSRNIPGAVARAAKQILDRRRAPAGGGGGH